MDIVVCLVGYIDVCQLIAVVHPRRFICIQLADEPNTAGRLVGGIGLTSVAFVFTSDNTEKPVANSFVSFCVGSVIDFNLGSRLASL